MNTRLNDSEFHIVHEAAQMAVFRLYGYLGAGVRLVRALETLAGSNNYVACPFNDRMDIFQVSILEHGPDAPLRLQVVHSPDYDSVHQLASLPADTLGYWTAVLEATPLNGPFSLVSLMIEGQDMNLNAQSTLSNSPAP
jgi:hypothetical protein